MDVYYQVKNRLYKIGHLANNAPSLKRNLSRLTANQSAFTFVAISLKVVFQRYTKTIFPVFPGYTVILHTGILAFSGF